MGAKDFQELVEIPELLILPTLKAIEDFEADIPEIIQNCFCVVELVGGGDEQDVVGLVAQPHNVVGFALPIRFLFAGVLCECVGKRCDHAGHVETEALLNFAQARRAAVVFNGVVQQGGDHHVLCHGDAAAGFAHHQRGHADQVRHVRNVGAFAVLRVQLARVFDGLGKALGQNEARILGHADAPREGSGKRVG